jgi:hypothetical protein
MNNQPETITTYELNNRACPTCGAEMTRASFINAPQPIPGDAGLCFECGALHVFGEGLTVRRPTAEEVRQLQVEQPELWAKIERLSGQLVEYKAWLKWLQSTGPR